ncbi:MAG: hypothetical protein WC838_07115, partial [Candidatus Margulisiibacteriota bacterium]
MARIHDITGGANGRGDGIVDQNDLRAIQDVLERYDLNQDGKVSVEEAASSGINLETYDVDQNGILNDNDLAEIRQNFTALTPAQTSNARPAGGIIETAGGLDGMMSEIDGLLEKMSKGTENYVKRQDAGFEGFQWYVVDVENASKDYMKLTELVQRISGIMAAL